MHRKMSLSILHPYEFLNLTYTYENIIKLFELIECMDFSTNNSNSKDLLNINDIKSIFHKFTEYISDYKEIFNLDEIGKYGLSNITGSFLNQVNIKRLIICKKR